MSKKSRLDGDTGLSRFTPRLSQGVWFVYGGAGGRLARRILDSTQIQVGGL